MRPDAIIGFVPNGNFINIATIIARYFSLVREVEGKGATVPFPGPEYSWKLLNHDTSQDILARFAIHASLHPEETTGQHYNIANNPTPGSWETKWPLVTEYFGLKGVGPVERDHPLMDPVAYVEKHAGRFAEIQEKYGLESEVQERPPIQLSYEALGALKRDRTLSLAKAHALWGERTETGDVKSAWWTALERMKAARQIPDFE